MRRSFHPFKIIYWKILRYCPFIYIIYIQTLKIDDFFLLSQYFMFLLLAVAYLQIDWHIPLLIPFSTINNISTSIIRSDLTLILSCHANAGAGRIFVGWSLYLLRYTFLKFSNTSANNNVLLWTYKSWYYPKFYISESLQTPFACT